MDSASLENRLAHGPNIQMAELADDGVLFMVSSVIATVFEKLSGPKAPRGGGGMQKRGSSTPFPHPLSPKNQYIRASFDSRKAELSWFGVNYTHLYSAFL